LLSSEALASRAAVGVGPSLALPCRDGSWCVPAVPCRGTRVERHLPTRLFPNTCSSATRCPGFAGFISVRPFEICSAVEYPLPLTTGEKIAGQVQPLPLAVLGHISATPQGTA